MVQSWFISGANRGIGFELVKTVANQGNIVFAAVRSPSKATALNGFANGKANVHVVQLEATSVSDAKAAATFVEKTVDGLDVVIANAAIVAGGTNGSITVLAGNPTDLIIDINGYFAP